MTRPETIGNSRWSGPFAFQAPSPEPALPLATAKRAGGQGWAPLTDAGGARFGSRRRPSGATRVWNVGIATSLVALVVEGARHRGTTLSASVGGLASLGHLRIYRFAALRDGNACGELLSAGVNTAATSAEGTVPRSR